MSSFEAHWKRAHFQAALWKAAGSPTTFDITPLDLGWKVCGSMLCPWHESPGQLPAPYEVMNLIKCSCQAGCSSALCTCAKLSLTCTTTCKCKGSFFCKNPNTVSTTDPENPSDKEHSLIIWAAFSRTITCFWTESTVLYHPLKAVSQCLRTAAILEL